MKKVDEADWKTAAAVWKHAESILSAAKSAENDAREALIKLAPEGYKGEGVELVRVISEGRVSYKSIVDELFPKLDLNKWRSGPSTFYRIIREGKGN